MISRHAKMDILIVLKTRELQIEAKQRGVKLTHKNLKKLNEAVFKRYVKDRVSYSLSHYLQSNLLKEAFLAPNPFMSLIR